MDRKQGAYLFALTRQLLLRDVRQRYAGTVLGWGWLLIQPLFMLGLYTLVFGEILQLRFGQSVSSADFAFYLFAGLIVFNALSEVMTRAPSVLTEQRDMLLNTQLPSAVLPLIPVLVSIALEILALTVLCSALLLSGQLKPDGLLLLLPFILIRVLLSLAAAYLLAALGVFLRDLRQLIPVLLTVLLFISPILYPLEVIPERFLPFYDWNVLGQLVQGYRETLLEGQFASGRFWLLLLISGGLCLSSISLFRRLMPQARYVL